MVDETTTDQATEQSVEERIASKFGLTTDEPAEAAEVPAEMPEFAEIEVAGVKYQIPSAIKDGFLRNEDYTRKTQELAEQRRSYEHTSELAKSSQLERAFTESILTEQQELSVIDAYLSQVSKADWGSMSTDQVLRQKLELDNIKERKNALKESIQDKRGKFDKDMQSRLGELRSKARELASKSIKDFGEETEKSMRAFAASEGLTEGEIDNVLLDPRSYRVIYKAMQYDKVQSSAKTPVQTKPGVLKPGPASERMPAKTVDKLNYLKAIKKAGSSREKANLIEDRLQGIFGR